MGKLYVIGIGPGGLEYMTLKAVKAIEKSEVVVGYKKYIEFIKPLLKDKTVFSTGMGKEEERCQKALELSKDKVVSIVSTGDAGVYGMAGLILEMKKDEDVEIIPGVTASLAAASIVGAPLMHDNCTISLSDLMTSYDLIKKRVYLAAQGDFVISIYNPRSRGRSNYLKECIDIIKEFRDGSTPVAIVKNALRDGEEVKLFTLDTVDDTFADMFSTVIVGNSKSYIKDNLFITPRGYKIENSNI